MSVRTSMGGIQIGSGERGLSPGDHVKALNPEPGLWRRHESRKMSPRDVTEDAEKVTGSILG